jgi:hypothetical protein
VLTLPSGEITEGERFDVTLVAAGAVTVTVTDASGAAVDGARVWLVDERGTRVVNADCEREPMGADARTVNGKAIVYGVVPGTYTVVTAYNDRESRQTDVAVSASGAAVEMQLGE